MSDWFPFCPEPPDWRVDWPAIDAAYPWVRALAGCPQEPRFHGEGDVWTHTRLVCEAMAASFAFRALPAADRTTLFVAALMHDIAKPACTRRDLAGQIIAPHHGPRGAVQARGLLWRMGAPRAAREKVAALIRFHQVPFHLLDQADRRRRVIEVSQTARCDHLGLLAEADIRGRICADQAELLDNVALFLEACRDEACLTAPYVFASDHARFGYFRTPGRDPAYPAYDDTRAEVIVMSGLPGAGKDHWLARHAADRPVIALDAIREQLGIAPTDNQAPVVEQAREQARVYLRRGIDFAWNATNLSRDLRGRAIGLFADYHARIRIVAVEAPAERLWQQNRDRRAAVPEAVIDRLLGRWEAPDLTEAHAVAVVGA